jgi:hypothetical protein
VTVWRGRPRPRLLICAVDLRLLILGGAELQPWGHCIVLNPGWPIPCAFFAQEPALSEAEGGGISRSPPAWDLDPVLQGTASWAVLVDRHTSTLATQVDPIVADGRLGVCDGRHTCL